jgi:hypothetical protein
MFIKARLEVGRGIEAFEWLCLIDGLFITGVCAREATKTRGRETISLFSFLHLSYGCVLFGSALGVVEIL